MCVLETIGTFGRKFDKTGASYEIALAYSANCPSTCTCMSRAAPDPGGAPHNIIVGEIHVVVMQLKALTVTAGDGSSERKLTPRIVKVLPPLVGVFTPTTDEICGTQDDVLMSQV
jgi:hypothetical protein